MTSTNEFAQLAEGTQRSTDSEQPIPPAVSNPPINGADLLCDVERFVRRFVVLPTCAFLPLVLWVLGTRVFHIFDAFPFITLLSPEKGCGKTRTTEVLELITPKSIRTVCVGEANLFRLIESMQPTLFLDEAEILTGTSDRAAAVRSVLNAGNRQGALVPRVARNSDELKFFTVYCPKVVSAIRVCPDTIKDRAIVIPMQRKKRSESVERFIRRRVRPEAQVLNERINTFATENRAAFEHAYEEINVDFLSDRELENFEPLIAILTVTDAARLGELRTSAEELAAGKSKSAREESLSLQLLNDIRVIWPEGQHRMLTRRLLENLKAISDAPWAEESFNERRLSLLLAPYGVRPMEVRAGAEKGKGYKIEDLSDAFARYLEPDGRQARQPA